MEQIGICGTGLMGATMAQIFAEKGYETRIYGRTEASLERGKKIITLEEGGAVVLYDPVGRFGKM